MDVRRGGRVGRRADQQRELSAAGPAEGAHRVVDLSQGGHPGREDRRQSRARHGLDERQMRQVVGAVLDERCPGPDDVIDPLRAGGGREEDDVASGAVARQLAQRLGRELAALEHVVLRLANRLAARDVLVREGTIREKVLGSIVLKLDRVRPGIGRRIDRAVREPEIAVVVDAHLRGDEARSSRPQGSRGDSKTGLVRS